MMKNIKDASLEELKAKKAELVKISWHEYTTRGNTERCQMIWKKITEIENELERRKADGKRI